MTLLPPIPGWESLHPLVVHFPIALLLTGFGVHVLRHLREGHEWLAPAETWLLWLGTGSLLVSLALGLLAENAAPHVPAAWRVLRDHKSLAFWSGGLFVLLSLVARFAPNRHRSLFSVTWAVASGLLIVTAHHGAQLLFQFGMGVGSPS